MKDLITLGLGLCLGVSFILCGNMYTAKMMPQWVRSDFEALQLVQESYTVEHELMAEEHSKLKHAMNGAGNVLKSVQSTVINQHASIVDDHSNLMDDHARLLEEMIQLVNNYQEGQLTGEALKENREALRASGILLEERRDTIKKRHDKMLSDLSGV